MIKGKLKCESCNRQISIHQKVNCTRVKMSTIASREVFNKLVEEHASLQHFMEVSVFMDYSSPIRYVMWFQDSVKHKGIVRKSVSPYRMFYENLKQCKKCLYEVQDLKEIKLLGLNEFEKLLCYKFNMNELKELAKTNYVKDVVGSKSTKRAWAKSINTMIAKNWGFNTFMVGIKSNKKHIMNGQVDVLLTIQKFL